MISPHSGASKPGESTYTIRSRKCLTIGSRLPFSKWFFGSTTNLCHNAVDRWLARRSDQAALVAISTEINTEKTYLLGELQAEVDRTAAVMQSLCVGRSERVLIYMPMIAEAAMFAMRACARIGAIYSVVFGGFASNSLASRIEDATLALIVSADADSHGGKMLLDGADQTGSCTAG